MKKLFLIRRIPNYKLVLFLILIAGVAEGIGVSALVPVLSSLTGDFINTTLPPPFNFLPSFLNLLGVNPSFEAMLIATLLIMLIAYLLIYIQERVVISARYKYLQDIRGKAVASIFNSRWKHLSNLKSGSVSNIIIHESDRAAEGLMSMMTLLAISVQLLVYGTSALLLSWQMFLIALLVIILSLFTARRLISIVRILGLESVEMNSLFSRQLVEFIRGSKLIKATGVTKVTEEILYNSNKRSANANRKIVINQAKMRFELQALLSIAMVFILYVSVSFFDIQIAVLLVFMFIIMRLAPRFTSFQGQLQNFASVLPAIEAVDSIITNSEEAIKSKSDNLQVFNFENEILFNNVSYQYNKKNENALTDINIMIKANSFVAFVGKSGSGKSTALDIIMGLLEPEQGFISFDGVDLKNFASNSFRSKIGLVSQDSIFFVGTIKQNLCFGLNEECDEKHIWECLKIAQLDDFILSLPDGLSSPLVESGINLSGGQRQRLAIARALIRNPSLLILDEATNALDANAEAKFQSAIEAVANKYTLIVVAHRLSTISHADNIFVFDKGKIFESGSYSDLIKANGIFKKLASNQN
jgi:ATP-binding cassette, subfamily B, bacterial MsbA